MINKAILMITQEDDSTEVDIKIEFDPPLIRKGQNPTTHVMAAMAAQFIKKEMEEES